MMKKRVLAMLFGAFLLSSTEADAQARLVTGKVTRDGTVPLSGASVTVRGTTQVVQTNNNGDYSVRAEPGQTLQYRLIGYQMAQRLYTGEATINVNLEKAAANLDAVVVTALGQQTTQRNLGTSQQTVAGADIANTSRENFVNALQGRVAGVEVVSSSGVPGASSSITIRGVSSISSSNQPLMIIDGLPMDNKTLNTSQLASDAPGSTSAFSNRGVDFTNRAADINPEDIETLVVLKGPEAAALYGIDAANGAIVITTKRGSAATGGLNYSNNFRIENTRAAPVLQTTYGPTSMVGELLTGTGFAYFGNPYPAGTQLYDNIGGFFKTGVSQQHNLSFSGGDNRLNYRVAAAGIKQGSVVPNSDYGRVNLTGATQAQVTKWLKADLSMAYSQADNDQPFKGNIGPLIGLMLWPQTDDAANYLTPAGTRRRITALGSSDESDNPYFSINSNRLNSQNSRLIANLGLILTAFKWGDIRTNLGSDGYTNENEIVRHPESATGFTPNGILDLATDITRNLNAQSYINVNKFSLTENISINGLLGNQISDAKSQTNALKGQNFLDPNFVSVNNTELKSNRTFINQRRLVAVFASMTAAYKDYLFLTATGRNDWTSTIPQERNSFFYPSIAMSFIASDAIPALGNIMTAKLRASYAEVGKDARPYAYRPSLENKPTTAGGYGYGFTGPNLGLSPEFARSYEYGTELGFLDDRVGLDLTAYRKQTKDQIVNDIRGSYATGFILFNLNGAVTRNEGIEATLRFTPVLKRNFTWDVLTNFEKARGRVLALPNALPESYVSDTWLFGNVRNGTAPGLSTRSLTGTFYLRNNKGQLLINPTTGLPERNTSFVDAGYDRQPDYTVGLTNKFRIGKLTANVLIDFRRGGDILNATQQFLTARGLAPRTLDRDQPRVIDGVLRDGKENSATPTKNTIVIVPAVQTGYYSGISEELFIEKDINWIRLRDVRLTYALPGKYFGARDANVFLQGTDLFLITNYSGLDPIVNGNTAAVGGSGAAGIDYGNFPMPRGFAFGLKMGY